MSAGTLAELSILMMARADSGGALVLDQFLAKHAVEIVAVDAATVCAQFRSGFASYGKGMRNAAGLNYGDLFAYALARKREIPLFYQGTDFSATDLKNAMVELGYPLTRAGEPYITRI